MFVIIFHQEHLYDNPAQEAIIGPYHCVEDAKADLVLLGEALNKNRTLEENGLFFISEDGLYLGNDDEKNPEDVQSSDIWCEVWAEITEVVTPVAFFERA